MNPIKKLVGINLLVLLAYSALIRLVTGSGSAAAMGILVFSAYAVGAHFIICLLCTAFEYSNKRKEQGRAWLLSSGVVLLIGFSTCLGNAALSG